MYFKYFLSFFNAVYGVFVKHSFKFQSSQVIDISWKV